MTKLSTSTRRLAVRDFAPLASRPWAAPPGVVPAPSNALAPALHSFSAIPVQRTADPSLVIQRRQHGDLELRRFLETQDPRDDEAEEKHGSFVKRVVAAFKEEYPQHDKADLDALKKMAWRVTTTMAKIPEQIDVPLADDFNAHVLGNQAGVGWHSERQRRNGQDGWSYDGRTDLATTKETYFAGNLVVNGQNKAGNNGRSTFFPRTLPIEDIRHEAEYVANTHQQQGQIIRGRGQKKGIMIDCLIRNGEVQSAYPFKPGW